MSESKAAFYGALYRSGKLTAAAIDRAVVKGWLTQAEADAILNPPDQGPEE